MSANPNPRPTFIDSVVAHLSTPADIDAFVAGWRQGGDDRPLHVAIGLTEAEYAQWLIDPDTLIGLCDQAGLQATAARLSAAGCSCDETETTTNCASLRDGYCHKQRDAIAAGLITAYEYGRQAVLRLKWVARDPDADIAFFYGVEYGKIVRNNDQWQAWFKNNAELSYYSIGKDNLGRFPTWPEARAAVQTAFLTKAG